MQINGTPGEPSGGSNNDGSEEFQAARRFVTIAQILSLVSLIIGGVVLSVAAIAFAVIGYRKTAAHLKAADDKLIWQLLKRSALISIVMAVTALVLNAITLAFVYPMVVEYLQSGDMGSLLETAPNTTAPSTGNGNSTWG